MVPPSQPHMFCPRPHSMRCILSTRAPSSLGYPFAAFCIPYFIAVPTLYIKHNIFNGTYILPALQFRKNLSNSNKYDGGIMLLSPNLSVRARYTRTQCSPSHRLLASSTLTPFVLVSLPPGCRIVLEHQLQSNTEDVFLGRIYLFRSNRAARPRLYLGIRKMTVVLVPG
jgi:hypothetical protein